MLRLILIGSFMLLCGSLLAPAAQPQDAFSLEPFLDDQTLFVARLKVLSLDADLLSERFFTAVKGHKAASVEEETELKRAKAMAKDWQTQFQKAGGKEIYLIYSLTDMRSPFLVIPTSPGSDTNALSALLSGGRSKELIAEKGFWLSNGQPARAALTHQSLVIGSKTTVEKLQTNAAAKRTGFASLLNVAGDGQLQAAFAPTADARKVLEEVMPHLPKELGGGPITHFTRGVQHLSASAKLTPDLEAHVVVQSEDANAAAGVKELWQKFVSIFVSEVQKNVSQLIEPVKSLKPQIEGNRVTLRVSTEQAEKLLSAIGSAIQKINRGPQAASHLRQLVIAMHNYHIDFGYFPTQAICDKTGKPLLSWRVTLLPYLEQDALYKQFKLDEPWDSEHNKALLEKMPDVFAHPDPDAKAAPNMTFFKVFYSKKGMKPAAALLEQGKVTLGVITVQDGTSNTALITDAGSAVPWTKPEDILFDPNQPLPKLVSPGKDTKFWIGFCDGSVSVIPNVVKPEILRAFITRNGGEAVNLEKTWYK